MRAEIAYAELIRRTREQSLLASCAELLAWDEDTYMPPAGAEHRAEQLALLAGLEHARATDPRLGELLAAVEGSPLVADPESDVAVNVREIRRTFDRQTRLPRELVEELARTTSLAERAWAEAPRLADFGRFRPWLEKIVRLKQREAESLGPAPDLYDALLDGYEPGARADELVILFDALRRELLPLVNALAYGPRRPDTGCLRAAYPVERQRAFGEAVAAAVGFDFRRGRLDTTTHPFFSTVGPGDCRITTRFARARLLRRPFRHPARGRPRAVRTGAAGRAPRHAAGRGVVAGAARIAGAAVGERRRPQPAVLAALLPRRPRRLPRSAGAACRSTTSTSPSTPSSRR